MSVESELRCPISDDLAFIRELVRVHGRRNGLRGERLEDLVLAVNEAVTNVLEHGGAAGTVTARGDRTGITVEVLDVAGRLTWRHLTAAEIDPTGSRGFGLWVIQHLCDDVGLEQTEAGSLLTLRVHRRPATAAHGRAARPRIRHGRQEGGADWQLSAATPASMSTAPASLSATVPAS
ncbi:ATP-binding protein [Nonomuraea basaltis]|uniref:ATP-binding protein n=1 Tax=Nonomuraea basaltis TaxID=2495887 RepID=UPI00110C4F5C|nr:ATP-binding protein [Nonomuraea basaltis]TMR99823.1 ATP-binding protein [Nonomuraea basaltis]